MNYQNLTECDYHISILMASIGLFRNHREFIRLNHTPDYNKTPYQGYSISDYFFDNSYEFPCDYTTVFDVSVHQVGIYHSDDFSSLMEHERFAHLECMVEFGEEALNACLEVEVSNGEDSDFFKHNGFGKQVDQFKIENVDCSSIELLRKRYSISGNFTGDSSDIDPLDWAVYAEVEFCGLASSDIEEEFYSDLLIKSYHAKLDKDYRMSFFLAYSAFEGFINQSLDSEREEERLSDKLNQLFKARFGDISKHQIYTSIIGDFNKKLTPLRNDIAHGRKSDFNEDIAREMLIVSLMFICSYNNRADKFKDIF
ncbi:hypothetical protein BCU85_05535 [Vibrio lentus]|uniref:hypothetical protein n=1 Tax=Vibrio lentus TaxID=136468 RepID=UPI000C83F1CF|nr:hypothetical protein [Vibrio lentus]PMG71413.1 hypothetical protein BCU85_05535 [Vibrio lentus]PMM24206.1 hypothetical protein BCT57_09455 [Vibrio lentus]